MPPDRATRQTRPGQSRPRWTVERQLRLLAALVDTRSVTAAARAAGMSRESAHRLRTRNEGTLFAALWDMALGPPAAPEGHSRQLTDGQLARLIGNHFRREHRELSAIAAAPPDALAGDRARTL